MPTTKKPKTPSAIDPRAAKEAWDKLLPRAQALPKDQITPPNTGVDLAAITALGIARSIEGSPLRARFERLPKEDFDIKHLHELPDLALAAWYAWTELLSLSAASTEAKIPLALADAAVAHRATMVKVIGYHFEAESAVGVELTDIIKGTGYRDLAGDLTRLARIYRAEHAVLKEDKRHHREGDADRADELSAQILAELGTAKDTEQQRGADAVARLWTLLLRAYREVSLTGTWLLRNEEGGEMFVSMIAAGRVPSRARAKKGEEEQEPGGAAAPGGEGEGG